MSNLNDVLNPKRIAIVGASEETSKFGGRGLDNLLRNGFTGEIYPVNPKYQNVRSYPCHHSISSIPGEIDAVFIATPISTVPDILVDSSKKGAKLAVIISSGNVGNEGGSRSTEEYLLSLGKEHGIRLIGPNCLGYANLKESLVLSPAISFGLGPLRGGSVGIVSQSGAVMANLVGVGLELGIGFSSIFSGGNQADLKNEDFLEYLIDDPETRVIGVYAEGFTDGRRFVSLAQKALSLGKPIVMIKVGASEKGAEIAATHTSSIAGDNDVYNAVFRQYGIIRVPGFRDFTQMLYFLERTSLPKNGDLAILVSSGGLAGIAADLCKNLGIPLAEFSATTIKSLESLLEYSGSATNPLDWASTPRLNSKLPIDCLKVVQNDENVGISLMAFTELIPPLDRSVEDLVDMDFQAPLLFSMTTGEVSEKEKNNLKGTKYAVFDWMEDAISAVGNLLNYRHLRAEMEPAGSFSIQKPIQNDVSLEVSELLERKTGQLSIYDSLRFIELSGLAVAPFALAHSYDDAKHISSTIGYPLALKVSSKEVSHKLDAGGVILGVKDERGLKNAFETLMRNIETEMKDAEVEGVLIQKMVSDSGIEMIISIQDDPVFGIVNMVGLGGTFVEVLKDTVLHIGHMNVDQPLKLIQRLRSRNLLSGFRDLSPLDVRSLSTCMVRLNEIGISFAARVKQIEINPIKVLEEGKSAIVLDCRVILR